MKPKAISSFAGAKILAVNHEENNSYFGAKHVSISKQPYSFKALRRFVTIVPFFMKKIDECKFDKCFFRYVMMDLPSPNPWTNNLHVTKVRQSRYHYTLSKSANDSFDSIEINGGI